MADGITFNVDAALQKLGELVQAHGQQVVDTAASVVQVNAANELIGAVGWALVVAVFALLARKGAAKWRATGGNFLDVHPLWVISTVLMSMAAIGVLIFAVIPPIFSVWNWVALFNPKLALAHDIMLRVAGIG